MTETEQQILELINRASKILVCSHIRPDWDAVASALLTSEFIKTKFPQKTLHVGIEHGDIYGAEYLPNYDTIDTRDIAKQIAEFGPDLLIIVDCPSVKRISFSENSVIDLIKNTGIPVICIDHHETEKNELRMFLINNNANAAVEEVYSLFHQRYMFPDTHIMRQYLASGLLSDTNNFLFLKSSSSQTFDFAQYLIKHGISLAEVDRLQNQYTLDHLAILGEFFTNLNITEFITYSYVSDSFYSRHPSISRDRYTETKEIFQLHFLRQVSKNELFFILYPELPGYKGSLRAINNAYDCTVLAKNLGGGGHKSACGFKLKDATTVEHAVEITITSLLKDLEAARLKEI